MLVVLEATFENQREKTLHALQEQLFAQGGLGPWY